MELLESGGSSSIIALLLWCLAGANRPASQGKQGWEEFVDVEIDHNQISIELTLVSPAGLWSSATHSRHIDWAERIRRRIM
ncbi:hypothetical protein D5085_11650 [Ectothiorhodospiraceae bacterium BW-2]|nr:hypothetical protein D5085_11650 [Ectothiorhodospiraceae bacterium BW-2]